MLERNKYNELVCGLKEKVNNGEMNGFLQRFYCLNMINEMIGEDSQVGDEWSTFMKRELGDMYSSMNSKYTSADVPVVTIALLESCFPEFLDGSYNVDNCSREQRQAALLVLANSKRYQKSSSLLQGEVIASLVKDKSVRRSVEVPVVGDLSNGVVYTFRRPMEQSR